MMKRGRTYGHDNKGGDESLVVGTLSNVISLPSVGCETVKTRTLTLFCKE